MKKILTVILSMLLIVGLCLSCGGSDYAEKEQRSVSYNDAMDFVVEESAMKGSANIQVEVPQGRKVILTAEVELETLAFEQTIKIITESIKKSGGYVSDSSQSGSGDGNSRRHYYITARIPTDNYNDFLNDTAEAGTIIYKRESSSDVTSQYIDVAVRLVTLKQQEERLLALLEKSGDLESLIIIEERLSDVRYEIELFEVQKRTFDDLISYSTVNMAVQEVRIITETNDAFFPQLVDAITGSWNNFVSGLQSFIFGFIYVLPSIIICGGIICGIGFFVKKIRKKRNSSKKGEKTTTTMQSRHAKNDVSVSELER